MIARYEKDPAIRGLHNYISKGKRRQGIGSFCRDFLRFNNMPCRHAPLLVHFRGLPICMSKTQYSLSDDPKKLGAPKGFTVTVKDIY